MANDVQASGVQELIDRLSEEGVAKGQQEADQLLEDARSKANEIIEAARKEASEIKATAREEAAQYQSAGEEALRLAARDAMRQFSVRVHEGLRNRLQQMVHHEMQDDEFIKRMILAVVGDAGESLKDEQLAILLSSDFITLDEARKAHDEGNSDALTEFVSGMIGNRLREGVHVELSRHHKSGMTVRVVDQNVEIDLTDSAIAELLAQHILPRFRAIMREV